MICEWVHFQVFTLFLASRTAEKKKKILSSYEAAWCRAVRLLKGRPDETELVFDLCDRSPYYSEFQEKITSNGEVVCVINPDFFVVHRPNYQTVENHSKKKEKSLVTTPYLTRTPPYPKRKNPEYPKSWCTKTGSNQLNSPDLPCNIAWYKEASVCAAEGRKTLERKKEKRVERVNRQKRTQMSLQYQEIMLTYTYRINWILEHHRSDSDPVSRIPVNGEKKGTPQVSHTHTI